MDWKLVGFFDCRHTRKMATADRFEDLRCWQTARRLTDLVYQYSEEGAFANDFGLKDQIQRASVSIMSNIAEGFNSRTTGRFIDYLGRARGSATEVQAQLYVALDREYIRQKQFETAYDCADKVSRQIYRFTDYLQSSSGNDGVHEPGVSYEVTDSHVR